MSMHVSCINIIMKIMLLTVNVIGRWDIMEELELFRLERSNVIVSTRLLI